MQGRPRGLCTPAGYQARPHPTLVRVQGIRRKAQGKKLIPDPRPLTPATFIPRSRLGVTPLQTCPPPAGQTSLPLLTRRGWPVPPVPSLSRGARPGEAAPTAFVLTEQTARRGGRPQLGYRLSWPDDIFIRNTPSPERDDRMSRFFFALLSNLNPHYARDAVARSWRWPCHRATTGART